MATKSVYCIYEADAWLSNASRVLIGIYTSIEKAKRAVVSQYKVYQRHEVKEMVEIYHQTQGYHVNYYIDEVELNQTLV